MVLKELRIGQLIASGRRERGQALLRPRVVEQPLHERDVAPEVSAGQSFSRVRTCSAGRPDLCTPAHSTHMSTWCVTDAHRGAAAPQSAHSALQGAPANACMSCAGAAVSAIGGESLASAGAANARKALISSAMACSHWSRSAGESARSTMLFLSEILWA